MFEIWNSKIDLESGFVHFLKFDFFGNEIEKISEINLPNNILKARPEQEVKSARIFPAKYWVAPEQNVALAIKNIEMGLKEQVRKKLK